MSDIASLYIRVDSSGVVTASRSLDELAGKSQKVEEATRKVTKATDSAASSMGKYITAAAATAAVMKLIQQSVQAFMEAEKATLRMAMAMKNQGDYTRAALNDLKAYASQLQKVTAYEDDATLSLMANLKSYGMTNEEVKKATKIAMDFASAKQAEGMSVKTAAELLGKAYAGNTQTLARYGIVVGEIKDKSEKYNAVMKQLEQRFGGSAQAELLTYAGQWQKLKNQWSDIQEFLGIIFLKTLQAVQVAAGLVGVAFMSVGSKILQVLDILLTPLRGILMLTGLIAGALGADGLSSALNLAASAISDARARILDAKDSTMAWTSANYDSLKSFDGVETAVEKMGNTGTRTTYNLKEGTDKATNSANKLREEADKINETLGNDIKMSGLNELEKKLFEIQLKYDKLAKNPLVDKGLLSRGRGIEESAARGEARSAEIKKEMELTQELAKAEEELIKTIQAGYDASMTGVQKQIAADEQLLRDKLELYKNLEGFEDEYRQTQLEWIELLKNKEIAATGDVLAAEKKAADARKRIEYDLFKTKTDYIASGFGQLQSAFTEIAGVYEKGSDAAKQWEQAAKAMEIAQKAVAVVQAVAAIATQGLGDPYTAFARIAAMAATMGALLASIGTSIGGAGGGAITSAPQSKFSSSVLGGEEGELSESLKKSWEYLEDTYDMEYEKLTKIHNELKDLNDNITGLVTSIIRTGSVGAIPFEAYDGTAMLDFMNNTFSDILSGASFLSGTFGGALAGIMAKSPINNLINGFFDKLFSGGALDVGSTELWSSSTGIKLGGGRAGDIAGGAGVNARSYQEWTTRTTTDFWREDSYDYNYREQALAQETQNLFNSVFKNISEVLVELSTGLGQDVNKALNYVFSPATINLDGMSTEQISSTLNAYISAVGDTAVQAIFGQVLAGYQQLGEGLMETAVRLMVDKEIVLEVLQQTNQAYSGSTENAIALSEALIKLAGNLETLTDIASTYYDKFFTDEEKHLRLQEQLTTIFSTMNRTLPATRQAYRDVVESLDLTTTSGQTAYITLLKLAESADTYYSTLEDMADDLVSAAELAAQAIKEVLDATNTAIGEQISLAGAAASAARSAANEYRNIIKSLTDAQESIRGGGLIELTERFEKLFAIAMTGDREALSALPGAADKLLAGSLTSSQSAVDYARDQGKMLLALEQAKTISEGMVDWNEYHATLLETQVNVLEQIRDELAQENPNLEALERQAGLLESIGGLLRQQTTAIVNGNGEQVLLLHDQNGIITAANVLTTTQTGQVAIGNSWLEKIKTGVHIESAGVINDYLKSVEQGLIGNNSAEAVAAREAISVLKQTTSDGLIAVSEAKATKEALAVLDHNNVAAQSKLLVAGSSAALQAMNDAATVAQTITSGTSTVTGTINLQRAEIINGNLIIRDQNGLIMASNQLLVDQTGKITIGNTLTDEQTAQVITGNATQDVIKNLQDLNTAYSIDMLSALVSQETTQATTLEGILLAGDNTVSLLSQLVAMMLSQQANQAAAEAAAALAAQQAAAAAQQAAQERAEREAAQKALAEQQQAEAAAQLAAQQAAAAQAAQLAAEQAATRQQLQAEFEAWKAAKMQTIPTGPRYDYDIEYLMAASGLNSMTLDQYIQAKNLGFPGYAAGGDFSGGLRIVGEQGPELEYTGPSHIVNASKTEAFMSSNADLLAEIKKLSAKIDRLESGNYQIVKNTQKTARTLEKFDYDGLPAERAA